MAFAAQELRLISALVLLLATGLFLAMPFVLSIGSVVFLPLVAAVILAIILAPLADRLARLGLPNLLASLLALVALIALIVLALVTILRPATALMGTLPQMMEKIGAQFSQLRGSMGWIMDLNRQLAELMGTDGQQVVLAGPSFLQELAIATPSLLLEVLMTLLLAYFMIESRVRMRDKLLHNTVSQDSSLKVARVLRDVQDRVAAYILTVTVINLGVGLIVGLGAWAAGMEAPVMWGGLAALLNFLPYVGPLAMAVLLALFGLGSADTVWLGLLPAAAYLGLHGVESNFLTPSILGARFTMNPVMILLALSYFTWIWGAAGALLSVPILLTLTAIVDHLGRPNLIGFLFGEPLFAQGLLEAGEAETGA